MTLPSRGGAVHPFNGRCNGASGTEAVLRSSQLLSYPFPIADRESAVAGDAPLAACKPMGRLFLRPEKAESQVGKFWIFFAQAAPGTKRHSIPCRGGGINLCIKIGVYLSFGIHMEVLREPVLAFCVHGSTEGRAGAWIRTQGSATLDIPSLPCGCPAV